ncbi:MAG: hypothetical protein V2A79_11595 [Planctomycetota bacterium]
MNLQAVQDARLLVSGGMSANKAATQVGEKYGVNPRTVHKWAAKDGETLGNEAHAQAANARACAREQRIANREKGMAAVSEAFVHLAEQLKAAWDGKAAQGFAWATKACLEMLRLDEGEATSRIEHLGRDEFMAEVQRLADDLAALPN